MSRLHEIFRWGVVLLVTRGLGVTIDTRLNFKSHISDKCYRASRQIISFERCLKYLQIYRRLSMYKSFIQSNFFTVLWPGSFGEGKLTVSLENCRNLRSALFLITLLRVMQSYVSGCILFLFHFIVISSVLRCMNAVMILTQCIETTYFSAIQWPSTL